jgi:hypothetical protein
LHNFHIFSQLSSQPFKNNNDRHSKSFFFFSFNGLGLLAYPDSEFISESVNLLRHFEGPFGREIGSSQGLYGSAYTEQHKHTTNAATLNAPNKIRTHDLSVRVVVDNAP